MKNRTKGMLLAGILVAVHIIGLVAFQPAVEQSSYQVLREIQEAQETGKISAEDTFVGGGQKRIGLHILAYSIAGLQQAIPNPLPIVLAGAYGLLAYVIFSATRRYTKSTEVSMLATLAAVLSPAILPFYTTKIEAFMLAIPLWIFTCASFLRIRSKKNAVPQFLLGIAALAIIHPSVVLIPLVLMTYLAVTKILRVSVPKIEKEATLFATAFALWSQFILYKKAIQAHGLAIIWQNIPDLLRIDVFLKLTPSAVVRILGPVLIVGGVAALAFSQWKHQDRFLRLYGSGAAVILITAFLRILPWNKTMALLAALVSIILAHALNQGLKYTKRLKAQWIGVVTPIIVGILIVGSQLALIPIQNNEEITLEAITVLSNLPEETIIWAHPLEGDEVVYKSGRHVVQNNYYLFDTQAEKKYRGYREAIETRSTIRALELITETGATHILFTTTSKRDVGSGKVPITEDETCFNVLTTGKDQVIEVLCNLEET